jgi:hypothetical protein
VGPRFSRENGVRGVRTRQRKGPLRGGASRPARPRRLKAGAAMISPYWVKLLRFLGNTLHVFLDVDRISSTALRRATRDATRVSLSAFTSIIIRFEIRSFIKLEMDSVMIVSVWLTKAVCAYV